MTKQNKLGKIIAFYDKLPQEIKVSIYIVASYFIGQGFMELSHIQTNDVVATTLANIGLVFLSETKKRISRSVKK